MNTVLSSQILKTRIANRHYGVIKPICIHQMNRIIEFSDVFSIKLPKHMLIQRIIYVN